MKNLMYTGEIIDKKVVEFCIYFLQGKFSIMSCIQGELHIYKKNGRILEIF